MAEDGQTDEQQWEVKEQKHFRVSYTVVEAQNPQALLEKISPIIREGYEPVGAPFVILEQVQLPTAIIPGDSRQHNQMTIIQHWHQALFLKVEVVPVHGKMPLAAVPPPPSEN